MGPMAVSMGAELIIHSIVSIPGTAFLNTDLRTRKPDFISSGLQLIKKP
jgi:hypothetical protein